MNELGPIWIQGKERKKATILGCCFQYLLLFVGKGRPYFNNIPRSTIYHTANNNHPSREARPCKLVKIEPKSYTSHVPRNLFPKQYVTLLFKMSQIKAIYILHIIIIPNSVLIYERISFSWPLLLEFVVSTFSHLDGCKIVKAQKSMILTLISLLLYGTKEFLKWTFRGIRTSNYLHHFIVRLWMKQCLNSNFGYLISRYWTSEQSILQAEKGRQQWEKHSRMFALECHHCLTSGSMTIFPLGGSFLSPPGLMIV